MPRAKIQHDVAIVRRKSGQRPKSPELASLTLNDSVFYDRDPADPPRAHRHRIESRVRHIQMTTGKRFTVNIDDSGERDGVWVTRVS